MKYRRFGRTELEISEIAFGGGRSGGILIDADDVTRRKAVRAALDATMLPVVERTLRDAAGSASDLLAERVESHRKFLSKRPDEKKPTYRNLAHGFDVVTKQEVGLEIQGVDGFRRIDEYCFRCEHSRIRGSDQVELDFG